MCTSLLKKVKIHSVVDNPAGKVAIPALPDPPTPQKKLKMEDGSLRTIGGVMCCGVYVVTGYTCPASGNVSHRQNKTEIWFGIVLCFYFLDLDIICRLCKGLVTNNQPWAGTGM